MRWLPSGLASVLSHSSRKMPREEWGTMILPLEANRRALHCVRERELRSG
jgi:hypothetical protein